MTLKEELEAATESNRELDRLIHEKFMLPEYYSGSRVRRWQYDGANFYTAILVTDAMMPRASVLPKYTSDVTHAMSIIKPTLDFTIERNDGLWSVFAGDFAVTEQRSLALAITKMAVGLMFAAQEPTAEAS
jgi:hypothetical protein